MNKRFLLIIFTLLYSTALFAQQNLKERLERHVYILASDSLEGRGIGTEGREKAVAYIEQEMKEIGLQTLFEDSYFHEFEYKISLVNRKGKNIVGMIPGSDPVLRNEYIIIGAHYDHLGYEINKEGSKIIYPGADDNASGVAGMLEMARLILQSENKPKRTLLFIAYDAEESGLIGSQKFADAKKPFENSAIKVAYSLDMIGMLSTVKNLELKGLETLKGGTELMQNALQQKPIAIKGTKAEIERRTDTWPFGLEGIPAIYVNTGLKSPYHKPEDTADLLDYEGMAEITGFLSALVTEMSIAEELAPAKGFTVKKVLYGKPLKFGAQIGMGNSYNSHDGEFYRALGVLGIDLGLNTKLRLNKKFELAASALYDFNGSLVEGGKLRRHSLTIPTALRYSILRSEDGIFSNFIGIGPYYRNHFSQRITGDNPRYNVANLNRDEWGLSFQSGFQVMRVTIILEWREAITEVYKIPANTGIINSNFRFGVAYDF
jgi:aminopeptidase YwaD